ncbi:hypothetical protein BH11VER1_BH11VER1_31340 [soil metagenome]
MNLQLFKTLWGHQGPLSMAIEKAVSDGFDGIEGQSPVTADARAEFGRALKEANLAYIAEITTAGTYVPDDGATLETHLLTFQRQAEAAMEVDPLFLTVIGGCDAWPVAQSVEFFGSAMAMAGGLGITVSFETHRSRSFFNPWITRDILLQLPELKLTCDFSHWCVVAERLVMNTEPEILALCAERAHHVHARVGYDQGPQVPHPAAPEYRDALEAHDRWWSILWDAQARRSCPSITMTPEFGPDGYLHTLPFTQSPVADLDAVNGWMAQHQRENFAKHFPA